MSNFSMKKINSSILIILLNFQITTATWKTFEGASSTSADGLLVGTNRVGDELYVGLATYLGQTAPSELIPQGPNRGLQFVYGAKVYRLQNNIKYLAKDPGCEYSWVPSSNGAIVSEAIQINSVSGVAPYTFYVGRVSSFNSYHVGKVTLEHKKIYYGFQGEIKFATSYEVLVCAKPASTTVNPLSEEISRLKDKNGELNTMMHEKLTENGKLQERITILKIQMSEKTREYENLEKRLKNCEQLS